MTCTIKQALTEATVATFEGLCFSFASADLDEDQTAAAPEGTAEIGFYGPFAGLIVVTVAGDVLGRAADAMLGSDEPPTEELRRDTLREIANVIAGNALPRIAGTDAIFHLSPPAIVAGPRKERATTFVRIGVEGGRADVALYADTCELEAQP